MRYFTFFRSDKPCKGRCERFIDVFPRPGVGVSKMTCHGAITDTSQLSVEDLKVGIYLVDHTSSSSRRYCLPFFAKRPNEFPQK
jgi:hypothetical protein